MATSIQKEYTAASLIVSKTNPIKVKSVEDFFTQFISQLKENDRLGYAESFKSTYNSMKQFNKGKLNFSFHYMDTEWLNRYEQWLRKKNYAELSLFTKFRDINAV